MSRSPIRPLPATSWLSHFSIAHRIKLRFLEERIRDTLQGISTDLGRVAPSQAGSIAQEWQRASQAVMQFIHLLEHALLDTEPPTLDAEHYFATATAALDAMFTVFDQASDQLEQRAAQP